MRKANLITGLLLLALGGYVVFKAKGFPDLADDTPGPGVFPMIVALALIGLVILMLIENRSTTDTTPIIDIKSKDFHRAIYVTLALVGYVALLETLGFLVATSIGLLGTMLIVNREGILMKVVATAVTTASLYGVFQSLLQVPLP